MTARTREDEPRAAPVHRAAPRRRRVVLVIAGLVAAVSVVTVTAVWLGHRQQPVAAPGFTDPPPLLPGAPPLTTPTTPAAARVDPPTGWDVSHPQCRRSLPVKGGFAIVGITGGRPLSSNPCFADQQRWAAAKQGHAVYVNTGYPGSGDPVTYGRSVVDDAIAREHAAGVGGTTMWWLDVETVNTWAGTLQQNATVLDAMAARLQELNARVGIYSTPKMWAEIAGDWSPALPTWYATGPGTATTALVACDRSFAGSPTAIVQWVQGATGGELDHNVVCPAFRGRAAEILDLG